MAVDVRSAGGDGAVKGVAVHLLQDLGSLHEGGIFQTVGIDILAANGLNDQGIPQHGGPGILAGHLAHGVVAGSLDVLAHLEELVIGGGEMIPAGGLEDFDIIDGGEDSGLEGQDADLAVHGPGVKRAVGEVLTPAGVQIGRQVHELAGLGIGLDIEGGVQHAQIGRVAGGDGGADLVTVGLVVSLFLDNDPDGTGVLGVEVLDHLGHIGSLGVGADPDAGEVDDDLIGGIGGHGGDQAEHHDQRQKQSDGFFHVHSPLILINSFNQLLL